MVKLIRLMLAASCMTLHAQATNLAIKLELTQHAQGIVKQIIQAGSLDKAMDAVKLVKVPHVTIGFIENLQDLNTATKAGQLATQFIDAYLKQNPIRFEIEESIVTFNKGYTVLKPTKKALQDLKSLNRALEQHLNQKGYILNKLTTNNNYKPHLTLKNNSTGSNRLQSLNQEITKLKSGRNDNTLFFKLESSSFSAW